MGDRLNLTETQLELVDFYHATNKLILKIKALKNDVNDSNITNVIIIVKQLNEHFSNMGFDDIFEKCVLVQDILEVFRKSKSASDLEDFQKKLEDFFSIYDANIDELSSIIGTDIKNISEDIEPEAFKEDKEDDDLLQTLKNFCINSSACIIKLEEFLENGISPQTLPILSKILTFMVNFSNELGFDDIEDSISEFLKSIDSIEGQIEESKAAELFKDFENLKSILNENIKEILLSNNFQTTQDEIYENLSSLHKIIGYKDPFEEFEENDDIDKPYLKNSGESIEKITLSEEENIIQDFDDLEKNAEESIKILNSKNEDEEHIEEEINDIDVEGILKEDIKESKKKEINLEEALKYNQNGISLNQNVSEYILQVKNKQDLSYIWEKFVVEDSFESKNTFIKAVRKTDNVSLLNIHISEFESGFDFDFNNKDRILHNIFNSFDKPEYIDHFPKFFENEIKSYELYKNIFEKYPICLYTKNLNVKLHIKDYLILENLLESLIQRSLEAYMSKIKLYIKDNEKFLILNYDDGQKIYCEHPLLKQIDGNSIILYKNKYFQSGVLTSLGFIPDFFISKIYKTEKHRIYFDVYDDCHIFENKTLKSLPKGIKKSDVKSDKFFLLIKDVYGEQSTIILESKKDIVVEKKEDGYYFEDKKISVI